jgi:hypothetical protein
MFYFIFFFENLLRKFKFRYLPSSYESPWRAHNPKRLFYIGIYQRARQIVSRDVIEILVHCVALPPISGCSCVVCHSLPTSKTKGSLLALQLGLHVGSPSATLSRVTTLFHTSFVHIPYKLLQVLYFS